MHTPELTPYIGITDFTSHEQVLRMLKVFNGHLKVGQNRRLHVGVMMSYKTLHGLDTKWSKAFPPKERIAGIFGPVLDECVPYYCLHYADYDGLTKSGDLLRAIEYAGPLVDAIQLDMPWPDIRMLKRTVHMLNHGALLVDRPVEVILQIGNKSIEQEGNDPDRVVQRLEKYAGIIHRVLLDKSMGRGLGMDAEGLLPFARAIKKAYPHIGLVAAGGLGPQTIGLVMPLAEEFPDISIDAQGKLRPSGNALDPIDWEMAETYLIEALRALR